ncbi:MAG TPA: HAD family hydrolase [Acidimicrobiales bacterium]|nr:HAD family hydrolase [Acidimicrobiales bacterium]
MSGIELVVTDLDGTLWRHDSDIHPAVTTAVRRLEEMGIPLLVATGRRVGSTRAPLARIGLAPPAVVLNGSLGLHLADGRRFHHAPFAPDDARAALGAFRSAGLSPCVYVDHADYEVALGDSPSTNPGHIADLASGAVTADLDEVVANLPVLAFSVIGVAHGTLAPAASALDGVASAYLDRALDYPGMAALTVEPLSQSKWDGVVSFCRHHGVDASRVLAVGDGPNDTELLKNASVAVAPGNGHPAALAHADHTVPPPDEGGWAEILELL